MLSTIRHDSIFDRGKALPVTIIGVGATGSRVFASLVELGCTDIHLIDPDVVEPHNLANQQFCQNDVGELKIDACVNWYRWKLGTNQVPPSFAVTQGYAPQDVAPGTMRGVVFLLTDTMSSRREIGAALAKEYGVVRVIETRMASSYGDVYAFDPINVAALEAWTATLTDDAVAEVSPCGAGISVGPTAAFLANLAVWEYIKWCMGTGDHNDSQLYHHQKFNLSPWCEMSHNIVKE